MQPDFQGSGVLAFSDPAGAKACLAQAALLLAQPAPVAVRLFSNKAYDFYAHWKTPVTVVDSLPEALWDERPDWMFTGTSHPDSSGRFEVRAWQQAASRNIPVWAFVDHWTNFALRFTTDSGVPFLPDQIGVLDAMAWQHAVADGLPSDRMVVLPNPYLTYIATLWRPHHSGAEILRRAGAPESSARYVLYAPDPISLRNDDRGWAFDEQAALQDLAEALAHLPPDVALLVKPHPLQPMGPLTGCLEAMRHQTGRVILMAPAVDNLDLAAAAEATVGFHSNFLLEAAALGRPVLRYFPASASKDALAHLAVGQKLLSLHALSHALESLF